DRTANFPVLTLYAQGHDERALPCPHQSSYSAHSSMFYPQITQIYTNFFRIYFPNLRQSAKSADLLSPGYFAMQTFLGSVKKRNASSPPSRPTPLCFMPPKGTRRSRTSQQFTQTVPV